MARKNKIEMLCENCKKPQQRDETKSNENWDAFDPKQKCECGGKFAFHVDGKKL